MPTDPRLQQRLFDEALELPQEQRAAFLDRACGGDHELRLRVGALLEALGAADEFLAEPGPTAAGSNEKPGGVIGRYQLLQRIGEGGFGTVWMAEQQEPVRRKVALKVIKLGMDTRQVVARFEAERQALALMEHPNIAKVFDGGTTPGGRPYFVMELVSGVPITQYCDGAELDSPQRLELFQQVCNAVQHAHQKGVIHRDLKPNNILVTLRDGAPMPKVIDFGIAKATSAELTQKTLFTEFRQMVGTPEYMAPEQAELAGLDVDTRADVYSLGVVLYELLTGTRPFDLNELLDQGYGEMLRVIREDEPPRPSTRVSTLGAQLAVVARCRHATPATLSRLIRGDLDWIVMKALEKDRSRRYATANDLAADIGRHLQDEPVRARRPTAFYRLCKLSRRHRSLVAAMAFAMVALPLGFALALGFRPPPREDEQLTPEAAAMLSPTVGWFARWIDFERPECRVRADGIANFPGEALTVEFWVRDRSGAAVALAAAFLSYAVPAQQNELLLDNDRDHLRGLLKGSVAGSSGIRVGDGKWHHIAMTWRRSTTLVAWYHNGVFVTGTTFRGEALAPHGTLVLAEDQDEVGGGYSAAQAAICEMAEVRLWSEVRTAAQIRDHMNRQLTGSEPGLELYWRLDALEDLGVGAPGSNDVRDHSGHGNHGDAENGTPLRQK